MNRPDTVLYNGTIHTMEAQTPLASAIAFSGDRIAALASDAVGGDRLQGALAPDGRAIDLRGRTVIPGLIDAHLHFVQYSLRLEQVDIYELPSLGQTLDRVAAHVATLRPGQWVGGGGWNCNLWGEGAFPTRHDLDRVTPDHPAALSSKDGHSLWVNTRAMQLAGLSAQTLDVPGGGIYRDAEGIPTGILQENAMGLVYDVIERPSHAEMLDACRHGLGRAHRAGLTGIHDCEGAAALRVFQELAQDGELTLRVLAHIPTESLDAAIELGVRDGLGNEWLRLAGIKAFVDGSLGSRSAWMLEPYEGCPGNCGIPTTTEQALGELLRKANGAGLSVAVHAIGDAANRAVLDAVAMCATATASACGAVAPPVRNRIEHVQRLHPDDVPRLAALSVIASGQPIHATADIDLVERYWGARGATSYAWRSLLEEGTVLAFGSDAPVESISPLVGIHAAVTRRRANGYPGPKGWHPEQSLTVGQAVRAYTMGAAYASGEERLKGSLRAGKLADLAVLDRDIFSIDPMEILQAQVVATVVGGRFVYQSEQL
jgi:predicted amidohydrolase YtcJ